MPTLYTALRAQHRHRLPVPTPRIPKPTKQYRFEGRKAILASEQVLLEEFAHARRAKRRVNPPKRKIAIIGAGLAGLCAAYELQGLNYRVVVYEARNRLGGRIQSLDKFIPGKIVEGGAELIGSNHPLWNSYKRHFRLKFSDVKDYGNSPVRFGKHTLTFEESQKLTDELEKQLKALTELAESIVDPFEPWTNRNAKQLDSISFGKWVRKAKCTNRCKAALSNMLAADNGVPSNEQSLLGVLAMIKGGGLDRFWTDTEVFRCSEGNQQLAEKFAETLNKVPGTVTTGAVVKSISRSGKQWMLNVVDEQGAALAGIEPVDDVILAIPPPLGKSIKFDDQEAAAALRNPPATGKNVKYLMRLHERFWEDFSSSPTLSEDGPVDLTWETTEADKKGDFALVAFSGADDAEKCRSWPARKRKTHYAAKMEAPYPGIGRQIRKDEFMDWPGETWSKGSYYFPRVNEVTKWGPFWKAGVGGWLHFAGEHTCYAFMGYMEGALSSGYRIARRIAVRDRLFQA